MYIITHTPAGKSISEITYFVSSGSKNSTPSNNQKLLTSEWWDVGMDICLEQGADLHIA